MKIKKHQSGGIYYTPFFRESLQQGQQAAASQTTSKSGDSTANQIEKEMISVLKENGLPSDVDYFLSQSEKFLNKANEFGFQDSGYGITDLIRLQSLANKVRHNKELHTDAIDRIQSEGAGSEVAVSNTGLLYIYDSNDGNVKKVTANDYKENTESYQLLTNSQLADLRANSPDLKYDSSILTDLNATIGMKSIIEYITDVIGKFGKDSTEQTSESYKIKKGFDAIVGDGPDGYYKIKQVLSKANEGYDPYSNPDEQTEQITSAINYLYRILPSDMKNALRAQSIGEGYDPNTSSGAKSLLLQALSMHTDHEIKKDQSLAGYIEPDAGSGSGSSGIGSDGAKRNISYIEEVGYGGVTAHRPIVLGSSKDKGGIEVKAQQYPILDDELHQISTNNMEAVLNQAQIGKIIDKNSISMGDQMVSYEQLNRIMWDGSTNANRVSLPIDQNAKAQGYIKPDLNSYKKFQEFEKWCNEHPGILKQQQEEKARELGLNIRYDEQDKSWHFKDEEKFLVTTGYVSDQAVELDDPSIWFYHLSSSEGADLIKQYESVVNLGTNTPTKNTVATDNVKLGTWGLRRIGADGRNSFYKAPIFMPISDAGLATVVTENEYTNRSESEDLYNKRRFNNQVRNIRTQ